MTRNDMRSLYDHFKGVPDVRRVKGCKHGIVNALATGRHLGCELLVEHSLMVKE